MKTEVMSVSEFMSGGKPKEPFNVKAQRHFKKYGFVYKVVGVTLVILVSGGAFDYAFAAGTGSIDIGAKKLYYEIVNIGKWIIVFKGGIDTIKSVGNGDFDSAKKSFFSYLLIYLMLLGLPYGMDKVDEVFRNMNS